MNETAFLLGYEDANLFFRAFHVWEGTHQGIAVRSMAIRHIGSKSTP